MAKLRWPDGKYSAAMMPATSRVGAPGRAEIRSYSKDLRRSGRGSENQLDGEIDHDESQHDGKRNQPQPLFDEMFDRLPVTPQQPGNDEELAPARNDRRGDEQPAIDPCGPGQDRH